jgi:hypothetical protein
VRIPEQFLVHTVTVTPYAGRSSSGPVYGTPFDLTCMRQGGRRWVRQPDGTQGMATLTLYAAPLQAATIPPGSKVTWSGGSATVMQSIDHDSGSLGAPDHTEVVCQ